MPAEKIPLIAILLIAHTRSGPQLVFNYPPSPQLPRNRDGINGSDSDDERPQWNGNGAPAYLRRGSPVDNEAVKPENGYVADSPATDGKMLGVSIDSLEKLLSPGRWSDRKKFEVALDGLTFVSHPVYASKDGKWAKDQDASTKTERERPATPKAAETDVDSHVPTVDQADPNITITESTPVKPKHDFSHAPDSFESRGGLSIGTSENSGSNASTSGPEPLTAFHVVFALSKCASSASDVVLAVYEELAKKLSRALAYCQKQSSYVGLESRRLSQLQIKAKQDGTSGEKLVSEMMGSSELAWALGVIYDNVSAGGIAQFRLNGSEISLQLNSSEADELNGTTLDRHSAVLLLESQDSLLRELSHPDASPLAYFIREHTPTKSLQKQANKLGMPLSNILYLAQHLIKWRKARAIAPLRPRDTYVVSRDAPLEQLESHILDYSKQFSALPSLPQMLKVLSGRPVKYGLLIPSRDHRGPYMDILAYLVRHKFVDRLETSGWLQAPPTPLLRTPIDSEPNKNRRPLSVASLLSPQLRPLADDDAASISSERTAIPVSILEAIKRPDSAATTASRDRADHDTKAVRMVKDPMNPSDEDLLCLEHIADAVDDHDLRDRLPSLYVYFDGEAALEDISAHEGLKRSTVDGWLDALLEDGFLVTFRHV